MDPIEIYKDLKDKIVWLDIAPESAMNLVELAQSYGVSRNPITIALNRLEVEEWVVRQGSHFVVSPLTLDRIREITEIRSVLEVQAIIWAMHRASPDQIKEFRKILKEIENVNRTAVNRQLVELDVRFSSTDLQMLPEQSAYHSARPDAQPLPPFLAFPATADRQGRFFPGDERDIDGHRAEGRGAAQGRQHQAYQGLAGCDPGVRTVLIAGRSRSRCAPRPFGDSGIGSPFVPASKTGAGQVRR